MPGKGYKSIGIRNELYVRIDAKKKKTESVSDFLGRVLDDREQGKECSLCKGTGEMIGDVLLTKEDLHKAIKELESDITSLIKNAIKDVFAEMNRY